MKKNGYISYGAILFSYFKPPTAQGAYLKVNNLRLEMSFIDGRVVILLQSKALFKLYSLELNIIRITAQMTKDSCC